VECVVSLRDIREEDLDVFFEHESDPAATLMAGYPTRDRESFLSHWRTKILLENDVVKKTIVYEGNVVGNIVCWQHDGKSLVGYWIGREHWGQGLATAALRMFLPQLKIRPLHAYVATHNLASAEVLKKCGFTVSGYGTFFSEAHNKDIEETLFVWT
jgi:RimJ/RimL family protein N-acetyltransferase